MLTIRRGTWVQVDLSAFDRQACAAPPQLTGTISGLGSDCEIEGRGNATVYGEHDD
jgi:hypothetical protein